jgi:helix-turn-helix protein
MPERKQKKELTSLRMPHPKKLGLSVPPVLRLPHEQLIRPQSNESPEAHKSSRFSSLPDAPDEALKLNQVNSTSDADDARHADLASLADSARLAKTDTLGLQNASLANPARLANGARLPAQRTLTSLMDSLPEIAGFTKLHHQLVDHLYYQLSPKEQVVHIQLYRLSWGRGCPNCLISLPKLARRSNLSPRSTSDAINLLESKGLIRRGAMISGKGKDQGIEYWVTPASAVAKTASLAISASQARTASPAESGGSIEYKEEAIHEEPTQIQACVGVASRFTLEECRRYANHLQKSGQGITNPGGFATTIHRTGEADALVESFLNPKAERSDIGKCPDCKGQGFKVIEKNGREGAVKCRHDRLEQEKSDG